MHPICVHVIARAMTNIRSFWMRHRISIRGRVRPSIGPTVGPSVHRSIRRSVTSSLRRLLGAFCAEYSAISSSHCKKNPSVHDFNSWMTGGRMDGWTREQMDKHALCQRWDSICKHNMNPNPTIIPSIIPPFWFSLWPRKTRTCTGKPGRVDGDVIEQTLYNQTGSYNTKQKVSQPS